MPEKPNIILITTDQQRVDTLGIYGNKQIFTPNIDQVAGEGVIFENAFVQNTVCVPSRACIQTGRYTHQHGVTYMENVVDDTPGLPEWETTFMEHLQKHGYRTGATGKIHMYPEKGFDWQALTGGKGQRWLQAEGSPLGPGPLGKEYGDWLNTRRNGAYEKIYAERRKQEAYGKLGVMDIPVEFEEYVEYWIYENSVKFIEDSSKSENPFFLWCGFCGPHGPMDPPEPFKSMYPPGEVPLPVELDNWPSWKRLCEEDLMRRCIAYYWGMVTCIDNLIGKLIDVLRKNNLYDNTLIVYTSDHGEMLGERGMMGKCLFYDSVMKVPLWIKPPRNQNAGSRRIPGITEVMNIAPTILDYAGIEKPQNMWAESLKPLVDGKSERSTDAVFSEYVNSNRSESGKCIRTDSYKYFRWINSGKEEFYDLQNDPCEQFNLASSGEKNDIMQNMKNLLFDWLAASE
jgi:arylsulfatase